MIRLSLLVWTVVLALLGVGLFQVKYNVHANERALRELNRQIEANVTAMHVLEAEWSYLNDPVRLAELTRRYTDLVPTTPDQIGAIAELPNRPANDPIAPMDDPETMVPPMVANAPEAANSQPRPQPAPVPASLGTQQAAPAPAPTAPAVPRPSVQAPAGDDMIDAILADMDRGDPAPGQAPAPSAPSSEPEFVARPFNPDAADFTPRPFSGGGVE